MKNILLLFTLFSFIGSVKAQNIVNKKASFEIVSNNSSQSSDYFLNALSDANMETYRLRNTDVKITMKQGAELLILSATKLVDKGENLDLNLYKVKFHDNYDLPIFSVDSNGRLLAGHTSRRKYNKQ